MRTLLGLVRLSIAFPAIALASLLVLLASLLPVRIKGIRLAPWLCTLAARLAMLIFNVRFSCPEPQKFFDHQGFVFPNHISYFDILMMMALLPMRFLSRMENRSWPFIGWVAIAIGTVFVDRGDKQSRADARAQLTKVERYPPIVLYPEGGIGPARNLQPFRYGAFEIVVEGQVPFLPCAITYSQPEVVAWGNESFLKAFWRLARHPGPIDARLIPLTAVQPGPAADPRQLAAQAHQAVAAALGVPSQM
jgi:1-acyl-sn-glycerol-3-phosphate acyltransferase